ncbi:MAG: DUF4372 domain-containing protein [Saprospiraceae bacterium]
MSYIRVTTQKYNIDKNKNFVGQPVLSKIVDIIPEGIFNKANRKHQSNRYYKKLPLRVHVVSLLYGVFRYCNGLRELDEGMLGCEGKLIHLGFDKAPVRSTLSDDELLICHTFSRTRMK